MNNVNNLPASIQNMVTGLAQSAAAITDGGSGDAYLKMDKNTGIFMYGAEETEVEEGSKWAVNPYSFIHGFIAWGDGSKLGEVMTPAVQPVPLRSELPDVGGDGWNEQVGMQMRCVSGEDEGTQVLYKGSALGLKKAYQGLLVEVINQIKSGNADMVPVVVLESDSYKHKKYGRIYTPQLRIVEWSGELTVKLETDKPEEAPEISEETKAQVAKTDEPQPRRQRRRTV